MLLAIECVCEWILKGFWAWHGSIVGSQLAFRSDFESKCYKVLYFFFIAARKKKKTANRQFFNGVEKPAILSQVRSRGIHVSVAPEAWQFFINWVAIWKFVQRNKKRRVGIRKTKEKLLINQFPDFLPKHWDKVHISYFRFLEL